MNSEAEPTDANNVVDLETWKKEHTQTVEQPKNIDNIGEKVAQYGYEQQKAAAERLEKKMCLAEIASTMLADDIPELGELAADNEGAVLVEVAELVADMLYKDGKHYDASLQYKELLQERRARMAVADDRPDAEEAEPNEELPLAA
jgi:hypothetical protein